MSVTARAETDDADSGILGDESVDPVGNGLDEVWVSLDLSSEPGPQPSSNLHKRKACAQNSNRSPTNADIT